MAKARVVEVQELETELGRTRAALAAARDCLQAATADTTLTVAEAERLKAAADADRKALEEVETPKCIGLNV